MARVLWLSVLVCVVQCLPMSQDELEDFSNFLLKTSSLDLHVKTGADPDNEFDEEEVVSDHAWEESGKFEGDLILNDRQRRLIVENVEGLSRNGLTDSTKRWPDNEVVYFIQREHFNSDQVQAIMAGIEDLAQASCVKFRPYRKGDRDAVVIQGSRRGCFSQVGYQGGYQVLNLSGRHPVGRGCFRHGTVIHELLHSLGFYHMQSSPDRDDYIDVVWGNIVQPARHNFRKYNSFSVSDFGVGYDYDSVLHYSRRAFSANGQDTLVPKKSGAQIGQRVGLSDKDTQKLNKMYCDADNDPAIEADENASKKAKNKKRKPKNKPFEGQGIGYHQGKIVVIKLPEAEIYKLPNVPTTHVFDFSKTPQTVSPEAESYRFGEEITYLYKPVSSLNTETSSDSFHPKVEIVLKNIKPHKHKTVETSKDDQNERSIFQRSNEPNKIVTVPDSNIDDKDLQDAYDRLAKIVEQQLYPHSKNEKYDYNINKDYSKFYTPVSSQRKTRIRGSLDDNFEQPIFYDSLTRLQEQTAVTHDPELSHRNPKGKSSYLLQDRMDVSFGTSLPVKKSYSSYEQTETPNYATLEYLKNRQDFSDIYSDSPNSSHGEEILNKSKYNDDIKINPYDQGFYTDYVNRDKDDLSDTHLRKNLRQEVNPVKYERKESYIFLPTQKPYSAQQELKTPEYASLEYLKNRHDITDVYPPKESYHDNKGKNESYKVLEEDPATGDDWYTKEFYTHNPVNHDQSPHFDSAHEKRGKDNSSEYKNSGEVDKNYRDSNSSITNSEYTSRHKNEDFYPNYVKKDKTENLKNENENNRASSTEQKEAKANTDKEYDVDDSFEKYRKEYDVHSTAALRDNKDYREKSELKKVKHIQGFFPNFEKQISVTRRSLGEPHEDSKELSKKSKSLTLYGLPVPLTKDWYKVSYTIP